MRKIKTSQAVPRRYRMVGLLVASRSPWQSPEQQPGAPRRY